MGVAASAGTEFVWQRRFSSGHDFSRANKSLQMSPALAAEGHNLQSSHRLFQPRALRPCNRRISNRDTKTIKNPRNLLQTKESDAF
jgi:hypothetical protein